MKLALYIKHLLFLSYWVTFSFASSHVWCFSEHGVCVVGGGGEDQGMEEVEKHKLVIEVSS